MEVSKSYTQDDAQTKRRFEEGYNRVFKQKREVKILEKQNLLKLELELYKLEIILQALEDWKPDSWKGNAFTEYVKLKEYLKSLM